LWRTPSLRRRELDPVSPASQQRVWGSAPSHHIAGTLDEHGEGCLDALEQAIWARKDDGLAGSCTTPDGVQYLSIRYTERVSDFGGVQSVCSRRDPYDNALAEWVIGLFKTELIRKKGPWRGLDDIEFGTLEWVDRGTTPGCWVRSG
jgi:transposase InsO family protein